MNEFARRRRNRIRLGLAAAAGAALLFWHTDDWSRDFTAHEAEIALYAEDPRLQPLYSTRPTVELIEAIRRAGLRIGNWEHIGESSDGESTQVLFVRTHRLLRFKDDITMRIEDLGDRRRVTGESRSRLAVGDLGRNPRNLRRVLRELRSVLDGAVP